MDIRGTEGVGRTPKIDRMKALKKTMSQPGTGEARSTSDAIELSEKAQLLSKLANISDVRWEKVLEIRRQIESGEYETDEKMEQAIDNMLSELYGV